MTTQGLATNKVTIPITLDGVKGDTLDGTLTLSTCSNVCLLTDYPLHLDFTQPVDEASAASSSRRCAPCPVRQAYRLISPPGSLATSW
jgi:suppressor for copper-sensitivity B